MFDKIEFSDLYKFLTSVGIILIISSFIIPWLFMKQDLGIIISQVDFDNLSEYSKSLTQKRIFLNIVSIQIVPWLSLFIFGSGVALTGYGIYKWKIKQNIVDETEQLNLLKLKEEIKTLLPAEVQKKAEAEVEQEINATDDNNLEPKTESNIVALDKDTMKTNLLDMENEFFKKIIDYNSFEYEVLQNIIINNQYEIDIVLRSFTLNKFRDILIEIKYLQNKLSMSLVRESVQKFRKTQIYYSDSTKRRSKIIYIVVYRNDIATIDETNRFINACKSFETEIGSPLFRLIVLSQEQAINYDINKIIK